VLMARYSSAWAVIVTSGHVTFVQLVRDTEVEYELPSLYLRVTFPAVPALITYVQPESMLTGVRVPEVPVVPEGVVA